MPKLPESPNTVKLALASDARLASESFSSACFLTTATCGVREKSLNHAEAQFRFRGVNGWAGWLPISLLSVILYNFRNGHGKTMKFHII